MAELRLLRQDPAEHKNPVARHGDECPITVTRGEHREGYHTRANGEEPPEEL